MSERGFNVGDQVRIIGPSVTGNEPGGEGEVSAALSTRNRCPYQVRLKDETGRCHWYWFTAASLERIEDAAAVEPTSAPTGDADAVKVWRLEGTHIPLGGRAPYAVEAFVIAETQSAAEREFRARVLTGADADITAVCRVGNDTIPVLVAEELGT